MFAKDLTNVQIKSRIKKLINHKVIKEIDLYLTELRRRKIAFQFRIFSEMIKEQSQ